MSRIRQAARATLLTWLVTGAAGEGSATVSGLADPTRPLDAPVAAPEPEATRQVRPTLESVLIGGGRRVAVINGVRMTEGEERQGVKVWAIRPDGVVVSVDGSSRITLELGNARMHKERR